MDYVDVNKCFNIGLNDSAQVDFVSKHPPHLSLKYSDFYVKEKEAYATATKSRRAAIYDDYYKTPLVKKHSKPKVKPQLVSRGIGYG